MEAKDTVMNEKDLKAHAHELSQDANEDLIRLGLTRLELFRICKDIGLLGIQARIAFSGGKAQLADDTMDALRDPNHPLHKKIMGHATEAIEEARKEGRSQALEFINAYMDNDGRVIEQYQSEKDYIAPEWQPLVTLLDKIINKGNELSE
jgi:hypothetical protein